MFSAAPIPSPGRTGLVDELERRYRDLHAGDREAAARNLAVDLIMAEAGRAWSEGDVRSAGALRRYRRAAVLACGVLRLPMDHAEVVHDDTLEVALRRALPAPLGLGGAPIPPHEAAALTTRRAA
jgi:hypothetical protein